MQLKPQLIIKQVTYEIFCPTHAMSLVIICLLLLDVVSVSGFCFYTKYWKKEKNARCSVHVKWIV